MNEIVSDLLSCLDGVVSKQDAIKAVRILLKELGGQLVFFNQRSRTAKCLLKLLPQIPNNILQKWMDTFRGNQIYLPFERNAFRKTIAQEIYKRYDGSTDCLFNLVHEYGISYTQVYRLYKEGRDIAKQPHQININF